MANNINGLDHAVIAVRDLTDADQVFTRLGFTLTPRGEHSEWGTANHCIMFRNDYIALQAAIGEGVVADELRAFTEMHEGLHAVSLASDNIAAVVERLNAAGLNVQPPRALSRVIQSDEGQARLLFAETVLPPQAAPGPITRVTQHLTAERERFPHWLQHPNSAIGIASITAIVDDPVSMTPAWDQIIAPHASVITDETVAVHTGRGLIFLCTPEDVGQLHPEADDLNDLPPTPALVALAIYVADLNRAAQWLDHNEVEFSRDLTGAIRIPPSETCGLHLEFVQG